MDGVLRQVTDRTWQGDLGGYRIQLFQCGGCRAVHIVPAGPRGGGARCFRAESLADGPGRAREYVEANPLPP